MSRIRHEPNYKWALCTIYKEILGSTASKMSFDAKILRIGRLLHLQVIGIDIDHEVSGSIFEKF